MVSVNYDTIIYKAGTTYSVDDSSGNTISSGNADFSSAFTNAQTFLPSTGGKISIKSGYYTATGAMTINKPLLIEGCGPATTIGFNGDNVPTMFSMADTTQRQVFMRDFKITSSTLSGTAINASYFVKSKLENLTIVANKGIVCNAIGTYYNLFENNNITVGGVGSVGVSFDNTSNSNVVKRGRITALDNNPTGIYINSHAITLEQVDIEAGSKTPLFGVDIGSYGHDCVLNNPYLEGCDTNIRFGSGAQCITVIGGFIADGKTKNYINNGSTSAVGYNVRLQYQPFTGAFT